MKNKEFDAIINKIQNEVYEEAKVALGEKGFDRWRNPKFCGPIKNPDGYACLTGQCGDTMEMYIRVSGSSVKQVGYMTDGCSSSSIAGSFAAEIALGKTFEEVLDLQAKDVLDCIGTFPKEEEHCAHLSIRTLQEALNVYLMKMAKKPVVSE